MRETLSGPIGSSGERDPLVDLGDVWETLRQGRWLIVGTVAIAMLLAVVVNTRLPELFRSEAVLRISTDNPNQRVLGNLSSLAQLGLGVSVADGIDTDIGVLRSRQIAEAVVDSLGLQVEVLEPRRSTGRLLRLHGVRRDAVEAIYTLERQGDGTYGISVEKNRQPVSLPPRVESGVPFSIGGVTLGLDLRSRNELPGRIRYQVHAFDDAVSQLRRDLSIGHDGRSRLVEVGYRHHDPELVAAVPNRVAESFIEYKSSTAKSEARSTAEVLREQLVRYELDLRRAEERLQGFREQQQVLNLPEQAAQQVRRIAELQARRDGLRVERQALAALLTSVRREQRTEGPSPYRQLATFPSFISNGAVQDILHSLVTLENERAQLLVRRTPENADVRGLTERVNELELQLFQLANNYLQSLDNSIRSSNDVLAGFDVEVESIPAREVEFLRLMREQKVLEEIYTFLQTRLKEVEVQEAVDQGDVRIVDPALIPRRPYSPRPMVNVLLAAMVGLMMGSTIAIGRRVMDSRVRSRGDARIAAGGARLLGVVPRLESIPSPARNGAGSPAALAQQGGMRLRASTLVMRDAPDSVAAESYRVVRTHLLVAAAEQNHRVVALTSPTSGEGKTTTAANLAVSLAQQGTRVALIDAAIRYGGALHPLLGQVGEPGLVDLLQGASTLAEVIREVPSGGVVPLHCIFSGRPSAAPAELLASPAMASLLHELSGRYEMVVLDTAPLDEGTAALVVSTSADSTILVVRADFTNKAALREGVARLLELGVSPTGMLLNDYTGDVRSRARGISPGATDNTRLRLPAPPVRG